MVLSVYSAHAPDAKKTTPRQKLSPTGALAELRITAFSGTSGRGGGGGVIGGSGGEPGGWGGGGLSMGAVATQSWQHSTLVRPVCADTCEPDSEICEPPSA
jgi:hypothetical protein